MIQQLIDFAVNAVGEKVVEIGVNIDNCTANRVVSRWGLVLLPCGTIRGPVIACTVETSVVWVGVLWLILCSLPVFSVIFASFVHPLVDTFTFFIQLLPALFLQRTQLGCGLWFYIWSSRTVIFEMTWLLASKTDPTICCTAFYFVPIH